ncbi:MAG: single-stranded DNA-binding protein [Clostridia bacterium]|nr:single-stranded DNA-binding protein [Clostridia bacterium]
MASFNKVILIGNITAAPELKQTATGVSVCPFSIAVNRRFGKNEQGQQTVDFFTIVAWRQQAEFVVKFFKKGNPILVCGQLQTRSWTDNNGGKRSVIEVQADEVTFVAPAQIGGSAPVQNAYAPEAYGLPPNPMGNDAKFEEIPDDSDLPF